MNLKHKQLIQLVSPDSTGVKKYISSAIYNAYNLGIALFRFGVALPSQNNPD